MTLEIITQSQELELLHQFELECEALEGFPIGCPTLDIVLSWDQVKHSLTMYSSPSLAVTHKSLFCERGDIFPNAKASSWNSNGMSLAIAWSDGSVRIVRLEDDHLAQHTILHLKTNASITHIGWANCEISDSISRLVASRMRHFCPVMDGQNCAVAHDLPHALRSFAIEKLMPRLIIPPPEGAFTDENFPACGLENIKDVVSALWKDRQSCVSVMVIGMDEGTLLLNINEACVLGAFRAQIDDSERDFILLKQASLLDASNLILMLGDDASNPRELHLVTADLSSIFTSLFSYTLLLSHLISIRDTLRHMKVTLSRMSREWQNARDPPKQLLLGVKCREHPTKERNPIGTIIAAMYQSAVTGYTNESMRQWLTEKLADRGQNIWDKVVLSGLINLRALVKEHFIPAAERCVVGIDILRGIAAFIPADDHKSFSENIERTHQAFAYLIPVGQRLLSLCVNEVEGFQAFSAWLRFQVDIRISNDVEELVRSRTLMDPERALKFMSKFLTDNSLEFCFPSSTANILEPDLPSESKGSEWLGMLDIHTRNLIGNSANAFLESLVDHTSACLNDLIEGIRDKWKRSLHFRKSVPLATKRLVSKMDIKTCNSREKEVTVCISLLFADDNSKVQIDRLKMSTSTSNTAVIRHRFCCVDTSDHEIIDIKFLNGDILLIVCLDKDGASVVIAIPTLSEQLTYVSHIHGMPAEADNVTSVGIFPKYRLSRKRWTRPVKVEVHERNDLKGPTTARLAILESDRITWLSYRLPFG